VPIRAPCIPPTAWYGRNGHLGALLLRERHRAGASVVG